MAAGIVGIGMLVLLSLVVGHAALGPDAAAGPQYGAANVNGIATLIFTRYVFPFEVTSRAADHGGARGDGARAPGADLAEADAAQPVQAADGRRPPGPAARARDVRAAQRGGHARAAARRQPSRALGQPGHRRPARWAGPG